MYTDSNVIIIQISKQNLYGDHTHTHTHRLSVFNNIIRMNNKQGIFFERLLAIDS